jgi:hypothetical protein
LIEINNLFATYTSSQVLCVKQHDASIEIMIRAFEVEYQLPVWHRPPMRARGYGLVSGEGELLKCRHVGDAKRICVNAKVAARYGSQFEGFYTVKVGSH